MNDSLPKRSAIYDQDNEEIHFVEDETAVRAVRGFSLQTLTYLPLWFLFSFFFFLTTTGKTSVLAGYKTVLCEA